MRHLRDIGGYLPGGRFVLRSGSFIGGGSAFFMGRKP